MNLFLVKPESYTCIISTLEQGSQKHEHTVVIDSLIFFSLSRYFFSFQVKQENTNWMIRMEKARVS